METHTEPTHILVVDHDLHTLEAFGQLLATGGYRVSSAASAEEACSFLHLVNPDLIILAEQLPGSNGHELIARIKADPTRPFIPMILITGDAQPDTKVSGLDAGADEVMATPVVPDELLARVRSLMRLQRAQRGLQREQRKTALLLHLTSELGATLDLERLLVSFLDHLATAAGAVRASIILIEPDEQPRVFSSSRLTGSSVLAEVLTRGAGGWVLREGRPLLITDTLADDRWVMNVQYLYSVRSVACAPIISEGRTRGVVTLVHHTPGIFTQEHIELLESVAAQSAVAIENARLYQAVSAFERRERERLEALFRRYVSPQVASQLMQSGSETFGHPVMRDVAVVFADMRGFTGLAEGLDPQALVEQVLNPYFQALTEALHQFDGTIDKFLGDGVIAVFGSPIARPDDVERAILASVAMQTAFAHLCARWHDVLGREIGMGIGLSYGRAVIGNIGSAQRVDYTLIGDVVNTASRLSGIALPGQIIVSHRLYDALPPGYSGPPLKLMGLVSLKGKREPHMVYEVIYSSSVNG